jgi:DNA polymerase-3 subunit alpha
MSAHPLDVLSQYVDERLTILSDVDPAMENEQVQVAGIVNSLRTIATKKGDSMAFVQLEDLSGAIELVVFPRTYEEAKSLLTEDALLMVRGKVDVRDERAKLIAEAIEPYKLPEKAQRRQVGRKRAAHLRVDIPLKADEREAMDMVARVFYVLAENRGDTPFSFCLRDGLGRVEMTFPNLATSYSAQVEQQLTTLVGRDHFSVEWA